LAARGVRRGVGASNLPPRAQRRFWAGQTAALEGSRAVLSIGPSPQNLSGLLIQPSMAEITSKLRQGRPLARFLHICFNII
jgi:hypothetical protein